ncbi:hypothetical protein CP967_05640 [Streptomyces nitrosporeus]|uniref:DUF6571 domain-containing protein n=1 Tax=Streptomyces nitrosporeus TaxID=28894 RepID=A0A5J6F791_9ACTN|nr:DUF6571 family protein [Streptomyces nitrosporeus]QEU71514.1 hypothetical protein CP967_05640 [Streptomyces nitrosporeus]GGZ11032.1 hypothetical protein GCM10010327_47130 [Streptomyces nitrosporeus]
MEFEDVVNAPVGRLKQAADDWAEMAAQLVTLAEDARTGMKAKSDGADWNGVNAGVTKPFITRTAAELRDAAAEAEGVKALLADAYASFKAVRDELVRIRDEEAERAGVVISATGKVSPRHDLRNDAGARRDPGYPDALHQQTAAVAAWQKRIDRLVEDCSDADDSLKRALLANVREDKDFGAPKFSSLDAEQVDRAAGLLKKVTGEGGTARNVEALRALEEIIDDNRDDPEFATGFYRRLGAEGTLDAYTRMSLDATSLGPQGQDRVAMVRNLQNDMGAMLGLATQPSSPNHLDATWTTQLLRAGRKEIDVSGFAGVSTKVYGYQALGALLREGTYDKGFLTAVGRDMVAMDRKDPEIWSRNLPYDLEMAVNLGESGGKGFNPMTGLMEAMSNNPAASAEFFNEPVREDTDEDGIVTLSDAKTEGEDALSVVDYMLDKKPAADWYDTVADGEYNLGQTAMGNALEAAVTGRVPGDDDAPPVSHSKAMAEVMEKVVEKIGANPALVSATPGDPPGPLSGLAPQFGNMAAEYMPDLQATAENGAGQIKPFGVPAEFDKGRMAGFLGSVAQDPQAYGAITIAQQAYTTALVSDAFSHPEKHPDMGEAVRNAVHPGGEIAGMMTEARAYAVHELHAHEDAEYNKATEENANWTNRIISAAGGKYLEMIPGGGDVAEWMQEDITEDSLERARKDSSAEGSRDSLERYAEAERAMKTAAAASVETAGRAAGLTPDQYRDYMGSASTAAAGAHSIGRDMVSSSHPRGN